MNILSIVEKDERAVMPRTLITFGHKRANSGAFDMHLIIRFPFLSREEQRFSIASHSTIYRQAYPCYHLRYFGSFNRPDGKFIGHRWSWRRDTELKDKGTS